jgi:hypothetical protein
MEDGGWRMENERLFVAWVGLCTHARRLRKGRPVRGPPPALTQ